MADRFFDTSAAAKHYRVEVGTATVDAFLAEAGARHFLSDLSVVELHSVFARLVRTGQITAADFHLARGRFLADIASNLWQMVSITTAHFHEAQQLLLRHGLAHSLRTLDAIQLAAALSLNALGTLSAFVCADANLCRIAAAEGLVVVNPELP
jgi:predicted nucleic acid-binding protein